MVNRAPAQAAAATTVPQLHVQWPGGSLVIPLQSANLTLGRDVSCDIVIPSGFVSTRHATLQRDSAGHYTLSDLGSTNGLAIQNTRFTSRLLQDGDSIVIGIPLGPQSVVLVYSEQPGHSAGAGAGLQRVTIGRDPASNIQLPSPLVSWHHAEMSRDAMGIWSIRDLGSTNGTFVNAQRITTPRTMQQGDRLYIGNASFVFDGIRLVGGSQTSGGLRVDANDLVRTTRQGKMLLDHVTLAVEPGQFIAIAGGSGAGKTTLMRALAGIEPAQQGLVRFDGIDAYQNFDVFRGRIGYVPQADIVHAALTVDRALYYAARLRLASDVRDDEIAQRITNVLDTVGLQQQRLSVIASLSGGERKRVNLAVELLADPPILFLDEPNSGLDPHLRIELIQTLRQIAGRGRTVVLVTHHVEDIQACDRLAFIGAGGRLCYFGPPDEALGFFGVKTYEQLYAQVTTANTAEGWRQRFAQSPLQARYIRVAPISSPLVMPAVPQATRGGWTSTNAQRITSLGQLRLLLQRYVEIFARDRVNLAILLLQAPVIGIIMFAVAKNGIFTGQNADYLFAQRILFFLAVVAIWFGTSNSAREISKERDIYQRERLAGLGVVPYVLSKFGVLGVLCLVQTLVLLALTLWRTGQPASDAGLFLPVTLELYVTLVISGLAGLAMGLCVSAFAGTPDKAISAVPLVLIPQILLAGIIFTLAGPMQLVGDLTISRWSIQALGTSVNLNHLYYYTQQQNPALLGNPTAIENTEEANKNAGRLPFDPDNYGKPTIDTTYLQEVEDNTSWADAVPERQAHLLYAWFGLIVLTCLFTGGAMLLQRAKDPRWQPLPKP